MGIKVHKFNRGVMFGRSLSRIEVARDELSRVDLHILPDSDKKLLRTIADTLGGIEQRIWTALDAEAKK